ncbi:MAG TPA: ATP-binding protein [Stellaceae bacterium]|nr:ATP-binding protein [Stellaceae bacterium]
MLPEAPAKPSVLIVDSDHGFADELAPVLRDYRVGRVAAGDDLFSAFKTLDPVVAIVDLGCAASAGDSLLERIPELWPQVGVVATARQADARAVAAAFRHGAAAFYDKTWPLEELPALLQLALARREQQMRVDRALERLTEAQQAVAAASRAKSEFIATMNHELRTPLNAIIGFSEVILKAGEDAIKDPYTSYLADICESGKHLLAVINDILEFSKAEVGNLNLSEDEVPLVELVASVGRVVGPKIREANIEFCNLVTGNLPQLWCDERKLRQMLVNILTNAVKFTPSGGRVEVEAIVTADALTLEVRDTGIGIAAADLPRVVEPFVQLGDGLAREREGGGLGLPLVKALMEAHEGRLELESQPGKGTVARLVFPPERIVSARMMGRAVG